tara:strand:+ start:4770 stop:4964 length:195 start_codon:yes stop_codon:yes gene_type:complete
MSDEDLKELAEEAKLVGENDLAIVLYTYLGSKHVGMSSDFARNCQAFAREGARQIKLFKNRKNN